MNNTNKLAGLIALGAALVMPMAFAQTAPTADDSAMQSASPTAAGAAGTAEPRNRSRSPGPTSIPTRTAA